MHAPPIRMVMETDDPGKADAARALAAQLGLELGEAGGPDPAADGLVLAVRSDGLELRWPGDRPGTGVRADLEKLARPMSMKGRARQPLIRALGPGTTSVVDATAGLGGDAALLLRLGYRVTAIERHPVVAALLSDGLERARSAGLIAEAVAVHTGDAADVLRRLIPRPSVLYLDPMFPPKRKGSALATKGVRMLRRLVGDDADAAAMLDAARSVATGRVVVKRPLHAPPLDDSVRAGHPGKLVRYDVHPPRHADPGPAGVAASP